MTLKQLRKICYFSDLQLSPFCKKKSQPKFWNSLTSSYVEDGMLHGLTNCLPNLFEVRTDSITLKIISRYVIVSNGAIRISYVPDVMRIESGPK